MIHNSVGHVREMDGFTGEMAATNAKEDFGMDKDLKLQKERKI